MKRIIINAKEQSEVRVALLEADLLSDFFVETPSLSSNKGKVYLGIVKSVEQSLNAAFVDIGIGRNGFLPLDEVRKELLDEKKRLQRGQEILVQVTRDQVGTKGAVLTTYISMAGRFLVIMPKHEGGGISRRIPDDKERERLKKIYEGLKEEGIGLIIRTAGIGRNKQEINKDYRYLKKLWQKLSGIAKQATAPALIFEDEDVIVRTLRDYLQPDIQEVFIDDQESFKHARDYLSLVMSRGYKKLLKYYEDPYPIFHRYQIEQQLTHLHQPQVPLKGGGSLVIEPTEALVAIDVNSGRVKEVNHEETIYKSNLEAAREISRQIRLRDLGGIIVVDFIDMYNSRHKHEVLRVLKESLVDDKARIKVSNFSANGIVEITRQRLRPSSRLALFTPCMHCAGLGRIPTMQAEALRLIRKIKMGLAQRQRGELGMPLALHVGLPVQVALYLLNKMRKELSEAEQQFGVEIEVTSDASLQIGEENWDFIEPILENTDNTDTKKTKKTSVKTRKKTTEKDDKLEFAEEKLKEIEQRIDASNNKKSWLDIFLGS